MLRDLSTGWLTRLPKEGERMNPEKADPMDEILKKAREMDLSFNECWMILTINKVDIPAFGIY
jgi:hypothetical protein